MSWSVRVRGPSGQHTLSGLDPGMPVAAFQAQLQDKSGVASGQQEILAGFPPKPVQLPADSAAAVLSSLGITNGDTITVRALPAPPAAPRASAPEPAAPPAAIAGDAALGANLGQHPSFMDEDEDPELAMAIAASLADTQRQSQDPSSSAGPPSFTQTAPKPAPATAPLRSTMPRGGSDFGYSHLVGSSSSSHAGNQNGVAAAGGKAVAAPTAMKIGDGSCVVRRVVDSDNSCLFNAVSYVMERTRTRAGALRQVIAETVRGDPFTWNEGVLGASTEEYCKFITDPSKWGGAIELSILAAHYKKEIAAYDIQTCRVDVYGQDAGYRERVMVLYDGLHYDALAVAFEGMETVEDADVTVLETQGPATARATEVERAAAGLVKAIHDARAFTDTANFTLRCGVCQIGLKGEKEAVEHAKATGHQNFAEY